MLAELSNDKGERIILTDNSTYDSYIANGWRIVSISSEGINMAKAPTKKPMKPGRKGGKTC